MIKEQRSHKTSELKAVEALTGSTVDRFVQNSWGRSILRRSEGRLPSQLLTFTWDWINELMRQGITYPRLRLARDGKLLPPPTYIDYRQIFAGDPLAIESRADPSRVHDLLRNGATVVIDRLEGFDQSLGAFTGQLHRELCAAVHTNLFASLGDEGGFGLHADLGDGFVAQLSGSKRWQVFAPHDSTKPILDDHLHAGEVLYVPGGFPHRVEPCGDQTIHLTITVTPMSLGNLIAWVGDQYRDVSTVLSERVRPGSTLDEDIRRICAELAQALVSSSALGDYAEVASQ